MGVIEFFGTLIKNDITAAAIKPDFKEKLKINHLFLDFNSIIHSSSQQVIGDINSLLGGVLRNLYEHHAVNNPYLAEKFEKYGMSDIQKKINQNSSPDEVISIFKDHFDENYLDKLIITLVINSILRMLKTYCDHKAIETLLLAIDGVPSKGKMIEQKQRRYMGAIVEKYKDKILKEYKDYLLEQKDYAYLSVKDNIKWSRNKITPGTAFMHKLVKYLNSTQIMDKFKNNRPNLNVIVSDMYEVGEGEKKIVNYIDQYLNGSNSTIMVYSPDADVILLCMLLPIEKVFMLRYNDQSSSKKSTNIYDLIDIAMLKSNISYYINNHPNFSKEEFDTNRINRDIVCISTLFGNDFVPKIETISVKWGFQSIMEAYLKALLALKDKEYYLVKKNNDDFSLNFTFLKCVLKNLASNENDFIKNNNMYSQYINFGQIKYVFDYMEINSENLVSTFNQFKQEYIDLQNVIRQNLDYTYFLRYDQFIGSLKKSLNVMIDGLTVNTSYLTNKEMINLLQKYYRKYREFPKLNINLNTYSKSITDQYHKNNMKQSHIQNDYQKEIYKFDHMLDEYYIKFNAQPLQLTRDKINGYYQDYFGANVLDNGSLTKEGQQIMHDYIEGILWVFKYYFNDKSYINRWYYVHERAPLIRHLLMFLENIDIAYFKEIYDGLDRYQVKELDHYFNPIEQLIYVSPMTNDVIRLLPSNYRKYITSDNLDPFLRNYFIDINDIVRKLWKEKISSDVDCHSIQFFNKCLVKSIGKPTSADDKQFLKGIRKIKPNAASIRRSKSEIPDF